MSLSRRRPAALLLLVTVIIVGCGPTAAPASPASVAPTPTPVPTASPSPTPSPSPSPSPTATPLSNIGDLTGLTVDPEVAHRLPLAVMIDDSRAARPQSGFNGASIVYQSLADGFESRYLFIYQEGESTSIGPVRSARYFLVQWSAEVTAAFAHYGGDRRTRRWISKGPLVAWSVDGLSRGNAAYKRIKTRKAPHNAYTTTARLRGVATKLRAPATLDPAIHRRPFVDAAPLADRALKQSIRIPYRTNVITYAYDRTSNEYRRSVDGKAHIDPADGKRVTTTNVVVLFQKFRIDTKIEPGHSRPDITTIGKGKALIFNGGHVVKATWSKAGDADPTLLLDEAGKEIPLVRGRTFFQVVPPSTKITVKD